LWAAALCPFSGNDNDLRYEYFKAVASITAPVFFHLSKNFICANYAVKYSAKEGIQMSQRAKFYANFLQFLVDVLILLTAVI